MRVEDDGHLCLHMCDLENSITYNYPPVLSNFRHYATVAAAYANRAGYKVTFVEPGKPIVRIKGNKFFEEKKVK